MKTESTPTVLILFGALLVVAASACVKSTHVGYKLRKTVVIEHRLEAPASGLRALSVR